ncbi:fatty-acyl-CoA synthase [Amycolatopsis bartoniae]|uniref:Fatty acid--CoA ligase n=1 Tax=Amycolatopsis bartoniae TaxID=941986 RepID=A0A8H9J0B8_9PSEU|nr:class I adenylate-forming enzyme family protein [Amycolatopsis bartoniae]MBB2936540.1 fatty-acyl-CoA synthase [Amycolatopsis bartoniae]TVT10986.1 acyl--CoA ligase [Amycolatopsis bartoniae]GHF68178.1 fatty acid--CoA ligase [Amycolatopsis bartoniae]
MEHYRLLNQNTLPGVLRALGAHFGDNEAVVAADGRATFAALLDSCERMAAGYAAAGLRPGDRVGVLLPNGLRWLTATLGAQLAGLVAVPINTWYRSSEYAYVIERARLRTVVTDAKLFGRDVLADLADAGYGEIFGESRRDYLGALTWPPGAGLPPALPAGAPVEVPIGPDDLAAILFTSGSTAKPKPVPLRHGPLVANPREIGRRQHLRPGDRLWISAPFFFGLGTANALPVALTHATTLCLQERLDGEAALEFIERERCTVYCGLAPTTRALLSAPSFGKRDISSLRTGTTGFTAEDKRLVLEELGVSQICSMYGLTEAYGHSAVSDALDPVEVKLHTCGTALPTQRIRIVSDTGTPCPAGVTGEIELSGAVIDGYLDAPDLDAEAFRPGGWFRTGDLGSLDEHGRLHFAGRRKEMMKIKGINIAPAEVEDVLVDHPAVDQAFVMGVPGTGGDEVMACVLVPRDPGADRDGLIADVTAHIRANAASYKVPARFVLMAGPDLPLTDTGKVSKLKLREVFDA